MVSGLTSKIEVMVFHTGEPSSELYKFYMVIKKPNKYKYYVYFEEDTPVIIGTSRMNNTTLLVPMEFKSVEIPEHFDSILENNVAETLNQNGYGNYADNGEVFTGVPSDVAVVLYYIQVDYFKQMGLLREDGKIKKKVLKDKK